MDDTAKQALKESILHWEDNLKRVQQQRFPNLSSDACALCNNYRVLDVGVTCLGCPIHKKTGMAGCAGTPYDEVSYALRLLRPGESSVAQWKMLEGKVKQELEFLRSLEGETPGGLTPKDHGETT